MHSRNLTLHIRKGTPPPSSEEDSPERGCDWSILKGFEECRRNDSGVDGSGVVFGKRVEARHETRSNVVALFSSVCSAIRLSGSVVRLGCPAPPHHTTAIVIAIVATTVVQFFLFLCLYIAFSLSRDAATAATAATAAIAIRCHRCHRRHHHHRRCRRCRCFCRRYLRRYGYVLSLSPPRDHPLIPTPSAEHLSCQGVRRVRGARRR